jgi:hypothetical protein
MVPESHGGARDDRDLAPALQRSPTALVAELLDAGRVQENALCNDVFGRHVARTWRSRANVSRASIAPSDAALPWRCALRLAFIDVIWLREAYRRTRKDGALGVDGQSAEQYAEHLEVNLQSLLDRAKSGRYRAPPVRRVHIPKGDGTDTRPIGIPTFEDKVLQRAVAMVISEVYEQSFHDFSYGFRPGRRRNTSRW